MFLQVTQKCIEIEWSYSGVVYPCSARVQAQWFYKYRIIIMSGYKEPQKKERNRRVDSRDRDKRKRSEK